MTRKKRALAKPSRHSPPGARERRRQAAQIFSAFVRGVSIYVLADREGLPRHVVEQLIREHRNHRERRRRKR